MYTRVLEQRFLVFRECIVGVRGKAIADCIVQLLCNWQLLSSHLVGQTCDSVGAMAGKNKSAVSRIQEIYPHTIYTLFTAHALNMCHEVLLYC